MNEPARSFITHLQTLAETNRGALAHLKRSLGFAPGAYPPAFPHVERFVGADRHADDPWRLALYLAAGLFARHPMHQDGVRLAAALGRSTFTARSGLPARQRSSVQNQVDHRPWPRGRPPR